MHLVKVGETQRIDVNIVDIPYKRDVYAVELSTPGSMLIVHRYELDDLIKLLEEAKLELDEMS